MKASTKNGHKKLVKSYNRTFFKREKKIRTEKVDAPKKKKAKK